MNQESNKIIIERFKVLPKSIQDALLSADLPEKLTKITEKYHLRVDQAGALETETHLVMLGLEPPADFAKNVEKEVGISAEVTRRIADDVRADIFLSIRESLKQIQPQEELGEESEQIPEREETSAGQPSKEEIPSPSPAPEQQATSNVPPNLPTGDISSLKLGGSFKVPGEEKESNVTVDEKLKQQTPSNYETDPYHEPVE